LLSFTLSTNNAQSDNFVGLRVMIKVCYVHFDRMATEMLTVTITSLGNNPPQFSANSFTVQESEASPGGTFVFSIAVSQ
jgi:hypothetical protein